MSSSPLAFSTVPLPGTSSLPFGPEVFGPDGKANTEQVVHIKLTMFKGQGGFIFCAQRVVNNARAADIEGYVDGLLKRRTGRLKGVRGDGHGTPFDIVLDRQCIVLVELDKTINWRFSPGSWGVSTAAFYGEEGASHDFAPRFASLEGITEARDEARVPAFPPGADYAIRKQHRCEILFFKSAMRKDGLPQKFNFHIEFHQASVLRDKQGEVVLDADGNATFFSKVLPMIFDPDVGNNGGAIYPP